MTIEGYVPQIGEGIYTVPDVARILDIDPSEARRLVKGYIRDIFSIHTASEKAHLAGKNTLYVNFKVLMEILIIHQLIERKFRRKKIAEAHEVLCKELGTKYPFASRRLLVSGKEILFQGLDGETIVSADKQLQMKIRKIIENFIEHLDFDSNDEASRYYPLGKDRHIVVDPDHQMGLPVVKGTNIQADILCKYAEAGESKEFIAHLYNISPDAVADAIQYCHAA